MRIFNPNLKKDADALKKFNKELDLITIGAEKGLIELDDAAFFLKALRRNFLEMYIDKWIAYYLSDIVVSDYNDVHYFLMENCFQKNVACLAPRGSAKTTMQCVCIPLYIGLVHPKLFHYFLNIQATSTKGIEINRSIRSQIESNNRIIDDYGDQVGEVWKEKQFTLKNGVCFSAVGAGDSVRGKQYKNRRPDYIILDDIYDEADMYNFERIKKKEAWFNGAVIRLVPPHKEYSIRILGTAAHRDDLMHKKERDNGFIFKRFQAIVDFEKKKTLWPCVENYSFDSLIKQKVDMGSYLFNREMQNDCRDYQDSIIKIDWLKRYVALPTASEIESLILYVDPATDVNTQDYTAKVVIFVTNDKKYYIHEIFNDKFTAGQNKKHIEELHEKYLFDNVYIESVGGLRALGQLLESTTVPVRWRELTSVTKSKINRLINSQSYFENGNVFVNALINKDLLELYDEQLTNVSSQNDDIRDAVIGGIEQSTRRDFFFAV